MGIVLGGGRVFSFIDFIFFSSCVCVCFFFFFFFSLLLLFVVDSFLSYNAKVVCSACYISNMCTHQDKHSKIK